MKENALWLKWSIIGVCLIGIVLYVYFDDQAMDQTVSSTKNQALLNEIKEKAATYNEPAEDAYIDSVYKKTPARNGRKVNVEKSYAQMKEANQFDEKKLIFDPIPPKVSLEALPAAPIYRAHPEKQMVGLMINVSWGTEHIPVILKILKDKNVQASFFIEGKWAQENKDMLKMIHEEKHLIGNHAYNHPDMARISESEMKKQMMQTNEIIEAIIGEKPLYFAPPSGSFNDRVVEIAHELGMETILWTVDTIDWQNPTVSVMINRVMKKVHPGAMILMHPTLVVAQGLDQLIENIKKEKLKLGTMKQLLSETR